MSTDPSRIGRILNKYPNYFSDKVLETYTVEDMAIEILLGIESKTGKHIPILTELERKEPDRVKKLRQLIDPTAYSETSLQELIVNLKDHSEGKRQFHSEIWETHVALGKLGIPWPGPGITPEFRVFISTKIYTALKSNDFKKARKSWSGIK